MEMFEPNSLSSLDSTELLGAIIFGLVAAVILFVLYVIPFVIALWQLYRKAGRPGWAALIPFYSEWVLNRIGGGSIVVFWIYVALSIGGFSSGSVGDIISLAAFVFYVIMLVGFTKKYDRDVKFWVLLYLLPIVGVFYAKNAKFIGVASPAQPVSAQSADTSLPQPPTSPTTS